MIQTIKRRKELTSYLRNEIEDEGIEIGIDDDIDESSIAIIKVDEYYNGLHEADPPKSIDFCVVVDCECNCYCMYLLELKNVNSPKHLVIKDIHEKFSNTINLFLTEKFGDIFLDDKYKYKAVKLYLVSDAYGLKEKYDSYEEYKSIQQKRQEFKGRDSLRVDLSLGAKLYKFRGKMLAISFDIPPNPIIKRVL